MKVSLSLVFGFLRLSNNSFKVLEKSNASGHYDQSKKTKKFLLIMVLDFDKIASSEIDSFLTLRIYLEITSQEQAPVGIEISKKHKPNNETFESHSCRSVSWH